MMMMMMKPSRAQGGLPVAAEGDIWLGQELELDIDEKTH